MVCVPFPKKKFWMTDRLWAYSDIWQLVFPIKTHPIKLLLHASTPIL